jgi:potassium-transporting ATPase potassium-binding subunit
LDKAIIEKKMTVYGLLQIAIYLIVLLLLVKPLGGYMARVYQGERTSLDRVLRPAEHLVYRLVGIDPKQEMNWRTYAVSMLLFNVLGILLLYGLLRLQGFLPLNPQRLGALSPDLAFNTAVSFGSNTNWQNYAGETTLSYLTQMLGMTVQNFVSAATGMAILVALIRGIARNSAKTIGNFWVDLTRSILYILLPLSMLLALALAAQGVVQTFQESQTASLIQPYTDPSGEVVDQQTIALGPVAAQIAIKQLGTNGGGFFNTNSSHPYENPTPLTNFLEMLSILLIPAALCYTFGVMVKDIRQGWSLLVVMVLIFTAFLGLAIWAETSGNPALAVLGVDQAATTLNPGGNMEGKEVRFGVVNSALWGIATTAASNGSVNSMHDSYTPLGSLAAFVMMQLGEVVFGGVGSGLYGMLAFVIVAVFASGLMVGRTPEYLGKKIEAYEMKMASLVILIMPLVVLGFTALAVVTEAGRAAISNPGPHGFSQILYAFTSQGNNNGSAFAGLSGNNPFYNLTGGLAMLFARYWLAVPILALAGSLVGKKKIPANAGTLPTHTPLFVAWLIGIVLIVGALNFIPALALGPIVEHLLLG